jgi:hypothetical protein
MMSWLRWASGIVSGVKTNPLTPPITVGSIVTPSIARAFARAGSEASASFLTSARHSSAEAGSAFHAGRRYGAATSAWAAAPMSCGTGTILAGKARGPGTALAAFCDDSRAEKFGSWANAAAVTAKANTVKVKATVTKRAIPDIFSPNSVIHHVHGRGRIDPTRTQREQLGKSTRSSAKPAGMAMAMIVSSGSGSAVIAHDRKLFLGRRPLGATSGSRLLRSDCRGRAVISDALRHAWDAPRRRRTHRGAFRIEIRTQASSQSQHSRTELVAGSNCRLRCRPGHDDRMCRAPRTVHIVEKFAAVRQSPRLWRHGTET